MIASRLLCRFYGTKLYPNHVSLNPFEKLMCTVQAGVASLVDPQRQDMVATVGETTGELALRSMLIRMQADPTGRRILREKPTVNSTTCPRETLLALGPETFGRQYIEHMIHEDITADSRTPVRYVDDVDLAYVMQRYREVHDFLHTLTGLPITVEGELALKWYEAVQTGLPMTYFAVLLGPIRLTPQERNRLFFELAPWAIQTASRAPYLYNIYFEEMFPKPLEQVRRDLRIQAWS